MYIIHLKSNFAYLTHGEFVVTVYNFSNLHCKRYDEKHSCKFTAMNCNEMNEENNENLQLQ
jgi:hypothetical protein